MKEKDLFPPLKKWLNKQGFRVYSEIPTLGHSIDVVAEKENLQYAYELKLSLTKKVLYQAISGRLYCNRSYIVISTTPRKENYNRCIQQGYGIIRIKNNITEILLESEDFVPFGNRRFDFTDWEEGTTSGNPMLKGIGPACSVLDDIKEYLKLNPKATWKELYHNIQNHYSSPQSMASALNSWKGFTLR